MLQILSMCKGLATVVTHTRETREWEEKLSARLLNWSQYKCFMPELLCMVHLIILTRCHTGITHTHTHTGDLRLERAASGGGAAAAEAVTKVLIDKPWQEGRRWEFVEGTGHAASSGFDHWDATRGHSEIVKICRPHRGKHTQVGPRAKNLWKMKIFSRFHYVWYLVSASKRDLGCVCLFVCMHATMSLCPWLLVVIVCICSLQCVCSLTNPC